MAKKATKKDRKKSGTSGKKELAKRLKAEAKAAKAARRQQKREQKGKKGGRAAPPVAPPAAVEQTAAAPEPAGTAQPAAAATQAPTAPAAHDPVDQVAVLKLALRDTEAKLVAAEHRLRQVQQQLDDERRALAEATGATIEREEAVVDAAVAETVAEAVVAAELAAAAGSGTTDPTDLAAATLEEAAEVLDAVLADEAAPGRPLGGTGASHADAEARSDAEAAFTGAAGTLTPPLPEHGSDAEPNESWTLVHLRKEAERRGITGVSNLSKAALIERLRR